MALGGICLNSYIEMLTDMLLVLGLLFIFLSLYIPYNVLKIPKISVANNTLKFGTSYFDLSTAKEFLLNAKRSSFFYSTLSCVKITFCNGQMLTIDDWSYANIKAFKIMLNSFHNKEALSDNGKLKNFNVDPPLIYKGSFLWSFNGIIFIIMQTSMWVMCFTVTSNRSIFAFILIPLGIYVYFLIQANYVILSSTMVAMCQAQVKSLDPIACLSYTMPFRIAQQEGIDRGRISAHGMFHEHYL